MTHEWDQWGAQVPLTVLWLDDCQVALSSSTQCICSVLGTHAILLLAAPAGSEPC